MVRLPVLKMTVWVMSEKAAWLEVQKTAKNLGEMVCMLPEDPS